jgi:hypothetical protein
MACDNEREVLSYAYSDLKIAMVDSGRKELIKEELSTEAFLLDLITYFTTLRSFEGLTGIIHEWGVFLKDNIPGIEGILQDYGQLEDKVEKAKAAADEASDALSDAWNQYCEAKKNLANCENGK